MIAATGFFQTLFDLTIEEALVKFGFRYSAQERFGRLRRMFAVALARQARRRPRRGARAARARAVRRLLWGGSTRAAVRDRRRRSRSPGAGGRRRRGADAAQPLRHPRAFLLFSMVLRFTGLAIGVALRRLAGGARHARRADDRDGRGVDGGPAALAASPATTTSRSPRSGSRSAHFVDPVVSSRPGVVSVRALVTPLLLGLVSPQPQVANFRKRAGAADGVRLALGARADGAARRADERVGAGAARGGLPQRAALHARGARRSRCSSSRRSGSRWSGSSSTSYGDEVPRRRLRRRG